MEQYMGIIGQRAKEASKIMARLSQVEKNRGLLAAAEELRKKTDYILEENKKDVDAAIQSGMKQSLVDRLQLTKERIDAMAVWSRLQDWKTR